MPELVVSGLRKRFDDVVALDGCDLKVADGQLVGFLGPNGAGKTTTMRAILQLVGLDGGTITWNGAPIDEGHRRRIGYMPQERGLYASMGIREQIVYFGRLAHLSREEAGRRADRLLDRVGLTERADDPLQELSVGNQQRVQLAVALVHDPELLILDEPFAGLDPVAVDQLSEILAERVAGGVSVIFSTHQLDLVEGICEDVSVIAAGRTVAAGPISELRARSDSRVLEVAWDGVVPTDWMTIDGAVDESDPLGRPNVTVHRVAAGVDTARVLELVAAAGPVATVSFEPPPLDEVFRELVG